MSDIEDEQDFDWDEPVEDESVVEIEYAEPVKVDSGGNAVVRFRAGRTGRVKLPSGRYFSFSPGATVKMTRSDAAYAQAQGLGSIQE